MSSTPNSHLSTREPLCGACVPLTLQRQVQPVLQRSRSLAPPPDDVGRRRVASAGAHRESLVGMMSPGEVHTPSVANAFSYRSRWLEYVPPPHIVRSAEGSRSIDAEMRDDLVERAGIPLEQLPYSIEDYIAQNSYCTAVFGNIMSFIHSLIAFSDSPHWIKLTLSDNRDVWQYHHLKVLIVNYLNKLYYDETVLADQTRATTLGTGNQYLFRSHQEAAKGVEQVRIYVERGMPILQEKIRIRRLILMGNRKPEVLNPEW